MVSTILEDAERMTALVNQVLDLDRGEGAAVFVDSKVGKSTCFTIELPTVQETVWQSS